MENIHFKTNPIIQVIFQARFDTITNLAELLPLIRDDFNDRYPNYRQFENHVNNLEIQGDFPVRLERKISPNHEFISANNIFKINLTANFVSLTTMQYDNWQAFKNEIEYMLKTITQRIQLFNLGRIGLRFVNVIDKDNTKFKDSTFASLINCDLLGFLNHIPEEKANSFKVSYEYELDDLCKNRLNIEAVHINNSTTKSLLLDLDYFISNGTTFDNLDENLNSLHNASDSVIDKLFTQKMKEVLNSDE